MLVDKLPFGCRSCKYNKPDGVPKRKCLTCGMAYTSEYSVSSKFSKRTMKKNQRLNRDRPTDERLRTLYTRIRDKYFDKGYLPDPNAVVLRWKRGRYSYGGFSVRGRKELAFGQRYQRVFFTWNDENGNKEKAYYFVTLMIHEMIHLRLPHHRKTFRTKEKETVDKVSHDDLITLYDGLR